MIKRFIPILPEILLAALLAALLAVHALAATITRNPTANESPDTGQGGLAVTNATNTGHDSSTSSATAPDTQLKTCRWSGFQAVSGQIKSITLKFSWSQNGSFSGGGTNSFQVQQSVNGGVNWTTVFTHNDVSGAGSGSESVALSVGQNLAQVQLRDAIFADALAGGSASVTGGISDIRIEVVTVDAQLVIMM